MKSSFEPYIKAYNKNECLFDIKYEIGTKFPNFGNQIIHVEKKNLRELLNRLSSKRNKYVVYVEVGDSSLTEEYYIPNNVVKLYTCNIIKKFHKHDYFPFGILQGQFNGIAKCDKTISRENKVLIAFNPHTHAKRMLFWENLTKSLSGMVVAHYPWDYNTYFELLWKYKYVACPPGNGIDTYRYYEALHSGAIPIVLPNLCNKLSPFPAIYTNLNFEISKSCLSKQLKKLKYIDNELLQCEFWRKKMENDLNGSNFY